MVVSGTRKKRLNEKKIRNRSWKDCFTHRIGWKSLEAATLPAISRLSSRTLETLPCHVSNSFHSTNSLIVQFNKKINSPEIDALRSINYKKLHRGDSRDKKTSRTLVIFPFLDPSSWKNHRCQKSSFAYGLALNSKPAFHSPSTPSWPILMFL